MHLFETVIRNTREKVTLASTLFLRGLCSKASAKKCWLTRTSCCAGACCVWYRAYNRCWGQLSILSFLHCLSSILFETVYSPVAWLCGESSSIFPYSPTFIISFWGHAPVFWKETEDTKIESSSVRNVRSLKLHWVQFKSRTLSSIHNRIRKKSDRYRERIWDLTLKLVNESYLGFWMHSILAVHLPFYFGVYWKVRGENI